MSQRKVKFVFKLSIPVYSATDHRSLEIYSLKVMCVVKGLCMVQLHLVPNCREINNENYYSNFIIFFLPHCCCQTAFVAHLIKM